MQLAVKGDKLISEVRKEFSLAYPFLKIEFFKKGSIPRERYTFEKLIPHHLSLKDAWHFYKGEGELEFNNTTTVMELERTFMERFGLSVQLFRKSGNLWLETTITDNWTLKQQNDHGREISAGANQLSNEKPGDYDLNRSNGY